MVKAVIAVAAVLALACGSALAATPAQYKAQANAVCKATTAKIDKIPEPSSPKELGGYLKKALPYFRAQYTKLVKLTPAKSQKVLAAKALASEKAQIAGIAAWLKELDGGADPTASYAKWDKKLSPVSDAEDAAWTKLGIKACADLA